MADGATANTKKSWKNSIENSFFDWIVQRGNENLQLLTEDIKDPVDRQIFNKKRFYIMVRG